MHTAIHIHILGHSALSASTGTQRLTTTRSPRAARFWISAWRKRFLICIWDWSVNV
jgi:hypothetical protein